MSRRRMFALALGAIALLAVIGVIREMSSAERQREHVERLREEVRVLRAAADSCAESLRREEAEFRAFAAEIDSMLLAIRTYESMHEDGVPANSYERYIATFDRYNAGVPVWKALADTLQAHWAACRSATERYNQLVDSLRAPGQPPAGTG